MVIQSPPRPFASGGFAHGWNVDMDVPIGTAFKYNRLAGVERMPIKRTSGTLLGPEGSATPLLRTRAPRAPVPGPYSVERLAAAGTRRSGRTPARTLRTAQWTRASAGLRTSKLSLRDRKIVQNCQSRSVVKLLRAHGGCLGTRSR